MSQANTDKLHFEVDPDGHWKCARCGRVEYVEGRFACRRHRKVMVLGPYADGIPRESRCPGIRKKGAHYIAQGTLKCLFCWPFPTRITGAMRGSNATGTGTTEE
jgi:hypothetical protein